MSSRAQKLLFLDRDGVINRDSSNFIKHPDEWVPIPGSLEAIARATRAGFRNVVVTNQSGLGRGLFDLDTLHAIHAKMLAAVRASGGSIDCVMFCPHRAEDQCQCRKPAPGLLLEACQRLHVEPATTTLIGDKLSDMQAIGAIGGRGILVQTGERMVPENVRLSLTPAPDMVPDLAAAVDRLIAEAAARAETETH